jgi:magnesium chelatase subunit D
MPIALETAAGGATAWDDALLAAACVVVDPAGLGGIRVRSAAGPVRDAWIARLRSLIPTTTPVRPIPLHVDDGRLFGGLDLAASLATGRAVVQPGLLAQAGGGYALLSMAERIDPAVATRIALALEGDGDVASRFAVIAFDEGDDDEGITATLQERLAVCVDLRPCTVGDASGHVVSIACTRDSLDAARDRLNRVEVPDALVEALCAAAVALGIDSLRMPLFAVRVARVMAALHGRSEAEAPDAAIAARLVFATRARRLAATAPESAEEPSDDGDDTPPADDAPPPDATQPPDGPDLSSDDPDESASQATLDEVVLEAALAAIPPDLLRELARGAGSARSQATRGSGAGALQRGGARGAPSGVRRGRPRARERLSLIETLRAAAPWQRIRRAERPERVAPIHIRADDLHVVRFRQRHPATTVFVVDASGSSALNRLAEAKGAVELLLADCYVRRDSVAVLAFRGRDAQLLLPPTRSLVRARRSLAGLPGGGGTPVASALDATRELVVALRRRGDTVLVVLLTDGRANVARDGSGGRPQAEADALASARALRALAVDALLIDTSPKPHPLASALADAMGARYSPLPSAGAREMSAIVNRAARAA